ncbi:FKBP-type peptidyl-prolyl cis-trans isomerase [Micromonospora sp. NPDC049559]|uniref:FKBP-type peptidyl-prolyl cis-trans isomerase n=1 Tax=Micromonospora sp. NPDC049559 TaxID=3155923 RepID=UPI0034405526
MSDRTQSRKRSGSVDWQSMTKAERRAAAKAAAAKAAAARKRRQALLGALAGLAVVVVIVGAFLLFGHGSDDGGATGTGSAADASASAPAGDAATNPAFPPLPDGADPALGSKPKATAGKGELTKLTVTPLIEGKGPAVQSGQQITVNYVGVSYRTGEEFDASWNRSEPFSFQLGGGNVIQGWDQGLVGAKVGSRVQLDIPAELGYGEHPAGGQPGGPLRFVVDVLAAR